MDLEIKRWGKPLPKSGQSSPASSTTAMIDLKEVDIVIEAVDENFDLKRSLIDQFYAIGNRKRSTSPTRLP